MKLSLLSLFLFQLLLRARGDECYDVAYKWFYSGPPNMLKGPAETAAEKMCEDYKRDVEVVKARIACVQRAFDWSYKKPMDLLKADGIKWATEKCTFLNDNIPKLDEYTNCYNQAFTFFYGKPLDLLKAPANKKSHEFCDENNNDLELLKDFIDCHKIVYDGIYKKPLDVMRNEAVPIVEKVCQASHGGGEEPARQYVECMNDKYQKCVDSKKTLAHIPCKKETLAASEDCEHFFNRGKATVTGTVRHGLTKAPVAGATVSVGTIATQTGTSGEFRLENVPEGDVTLVIVLEGFIEEKRQISVSGETNLLDMAFALSPKLEATQWRFILSWGRHPRDLDLHLKVSKGGSAQCEAKYSSKVCTFPGGKAVLDVDEQQGYGPETITVTLDSVEAASDLDFNLFVHKYAGDGTCGSSGALVRAFNGDTALNTYQVPTDATENWGVLTGSLPVPSAASTTNNNNKGFLAGLKETQQTGTDTLIVE